MSGIRFLDLVKPFVAILPEVEVPLRKVGQDERVIYTISAALLYFVMSELPVYGAAASQLDAFSYLRPLLASRKGSLLELGTGPLLTSGFIFQILGGLQIIDVNFDLKSERQLFQSAQKFVAILITLLQAILLVLVGAYGPVAELSTWTFMLIVSQIFVAGLVFILLDEVIQKGYGYGTGIAMFTAFNIAQSFAWNAFALSTVVLENGQKDTVGAFPALFKNIWSRSDRLTALGQAFYRTNLPNITQTVLAVLIFGLVVYVLNFRVNIAIKSIRVRALATSYPIRLFYTGNLPLLVIGAISSNVFLCSLALFTYFPENLLVRLIGTWSAVNQQLMATSGIAYYIQPPFSLVEALFSPIKTVLYTLFVVSTCAIFSNTWVEVSGSSPRDVAKNLKDQGVTILGHRDVTGIKELKRVIPTAATAGGAVLGLISAISDIAGCGGTGTAVLVGTITILSYFEILGSEGFAPPGMASFGGSA